MPPGYNGISSKYNHKAGINFQVTQHVTTYYSLSSVYMHKEQERWAGNKYTWVQEQNTKDKNSYFYIQIQAENN
jgi:hypothetical protein